MLHESAAPDEVHTEPPTTLSEGEAGRLAYSAAQTVAARNQVTRVIAEFLSHFPHIRETLHPAHGHTPLDACRLLPLPALTSAAAAFARQW